MTFKEIENKLSSDNNKIGRKKMTEALGVLKSSDRIGSREINRRELYYLIDMITSYKTIANSAID